jgi:hypothetical protein
MANTDARPVAMTGFREQTFRSIARNLDYQRDGAKTSVGRIQQLLPGPHMIEKRFFALTVDSTCLLELRIVSELGFKITISGTCGGCFCFVP